MTAWAYVADVGAAVGGIASLIAILIGVRALHDSRAARLGAQRDRDRQRLELIARQLDRMRTFATAGNGHDPGNGDWRADAGLLSRYLAATSLTLPRCREVASRASAGDVQTAAVAAADAEIIGALGQLSEQGAVDRNRRGRASPGG